MEYPAFFEEHISSIAERFASAREIIANSVAFIFITDVHIHLNGRASVPLILELGKRTGVDTVLCGGDHTWAFGSKAQCLADFADSMAYMDPLRDSMKLYHARGNHDVTVRSSWELNTGYTMPFDQVQRLFMAHMTPPTGVVVGKLYYYTDDPRSKIRYIVLDTCEGQGDEDAAWGVDIAVTDGQLQWLCKDALQLPGVDWSVVVMGHVPCVESIAGYHKSMDGIRVILEAFKAKKPCGYYDFSRSAGELVAYICGHNHKDRSAVCNGVLHISTGCDSYCKDDDLPRDVGTINNTLFDLFLLNRSEKKLLAFRIGAGRDREFDY